MKTTNPILLTAGALALLVSAPSLGQSETLSLNYTEVEQTRDGVEPDEIDNRASDAQTTTAQSRRRGAVVVEDMRATDDEAQAGLLLPAVQNVRAQGNDPQPRTPIFIEIDDIDGESTDAAESAPANRPGRAVRRGDRR